MCSDWVKNNIHYQTLILIKQMLHKLPHRLHLSMHSTKFTTIKCLESDGFFVFMSHKTVDETTQLISANYNVESLIKVSQPYKKGRGKKA